MGPFCPFWPFIAVPWVCWVGCHAVMLSGITGWRPIYFLLFWVGPRWPHDAMQWVNGDGRLNVKLIKLRHLSASILWDTSSYMFWNICAVARLTASTPQASQVGLKDNYSFLSVCWEGFIQRWQHRLYISRQCFESGMNFWNGKKRFIVKSLSLWVDFKFIFFDVKDCLAIKRSPATKDSTIYLLSWGKNLYIVI